MIRNLPELAEDFLRYLKVQRGRTALTVRNYRLYLKRFLSWCYNSSLGQASDITWEKLRDYRLWLSHQRTLSGNPLSPATQNYHLTALRSFVNYLKQKNIETLPAKNISLNPNLKRRVTILSQTDLAALLQAVWQSHEAEIVKLRDEAIIKLLLVSGLKVSELAALTEKHLNLTAKQLTITRLGQNQVIPLPPELCQTIANYLSRRSDTNQALFIRHDRAAKQNDEARLTPRSVQRSLERYRKLAGLKQKVTPHTLRHSFAWQLAQSGADLTTLQKSLGLKHRATAYVYKKNESDKS
jgi:integrase/recombinase XerD